MKQVYKLFFLLILFNLSALVSVWGQSVQISTPSGAILNNYVRVEGTSSGVQKPMWYEVFSESGKMIDFGAFKQGGNWFFIARHLASGINQVKVYGANSQNQQAVASTSFTINTSGLPAVRPRPNPAELWWGGLGANQQIADNPDQWNMVKRYADGYFFHASAWGTENNSLMQSLIQQTSPYGTKYIAELGGGTGTDLTWPQWQHEAWGAGGNGWIINRYNSNGLVLSEITHDFQPNWKDFATAYPTLTENQCVDLMTNQWIEYFKKDNVVFPHIKHALTQSPVWWSWQNYPSLNPGTEVDHFALNGRNYNFNMSMVMENMSAKSKQLPGHENWAFFSDFPWYTMTWGEDRLTTIGDVGSLGWVAREKQKHYEQWLHDNGNRHIAVCNEDPGNDLMSNPNEWDHQFAVGAIKSIHLQQKEGHRPNSFLIESWYFGGTPARGFPDRVTPESDDNTFTGVAKNAIKYLKGIKDENGSLETLVLSNTVNGNVNTFTLKNTGDVACMPALSAIEQGDNGINAHWYDASNTDISNDVNSPEGWVYTPLLSPGASISIRCEVDNVVGNKNIMLEAFWNPQDPTGIVRDRKSWVFGNANVQSPYAGVINLPGIVEAENFDNGGEGVAYHDSDPQNIIGAYRTEGVDIENSTEGNYNLCFSANGEWAEYSVNVTQSGNYAIDTRVASMAGGTFHLEFNGQDVTGALTAPNTGGWQNWEWVHKEVYLNSGTYVMRFAIDQAGFNTNGFIFTHLGGGGNGLVSGQTYRLVNRNSGRVLDISECNAADGANAQQWPWLGSACQQWKVESTDNGFYKLTAQHSNKTLDIAGCSSDMGANIQQWSWVGGLCEQWSIEPTDNGYYRLVNRSSGQVLEVGDALTTNGANVRQWPWNGATCQQWKLEALNNGVLSSLKTGAEETLGGAPKQAGEISIFPNPADREVQVLFPQKDGETATIQIADLLGKIQISIKGIVGGSAVLDISKLSAGTYIVSVNNGTTIINKKLIVNR